MLFHGSKIPVDDRGIVLRLWPPDNNISEIKTSHLLNLRFLEHETELLDRDIYQAGLKLGFPTSSTDRLGLERSVKDENAKNASEVITSDSVVRLRKLIQEYGMFCYNKRARCTLTLRSTCNQTMPSSVSTR